MIDQGNVGRIFQKEDGSLWEMISYCEQPTATMRKVGTQEKVGGAIGSMNLTGFTLVDRQVEDLVRRVVRQVER